MNDEFYSALVETLVGPRSISEGTLFKSQPDTGYIDMGFLWFCQRF